MNLMVCRFEVCISPYNVDRSRVWNKHSTLRVAATYLHLFSSRGKQCSFPNLSFTKVKAVRGQD